MMVKRIFADTIGNRTMVLELVSDHGAVPGCVLLNFHCYREFFYYFWHCGSLNDIQFYLACYISCEISLKKRRNFKERFEDVGA